jgi:menaquinone-dependent protoporphyrinogen oxidase
MASVLIVYGTSHGQTTKIVKRIADRLTAAGHHVVTWKGDALPADSPVSEFEAILVAGSVVLGRHQKYLVDFVRRNLGGLATRPTAFVSVCGALMGEWGPGKDRAREYLTAFQQRTGWTPRMARSVAGGLPYTRYGPITRWIMKLISRGTGRPTDTSRDWEFTDWDAVDRLAEEFGSLLRAPRGSVAKAAR